MNKKDPDNLVLFDMDGTLCDYETAMSEELEKLKSPEEPTFQPPFWDAPEYTENRCNLIKQSVDWWANLPRLQLGWDILQATKDLEFKLMILTQGPRRNPNAWTGKKLWIDRELGQDVDITITRDKGLVYGKVLVDDYPDYIDNWLNWRKRGLVIMPANNFNVKYTHPNVIRYDGTNLTQVRRVLEIAKHRTPEQSVSYIVN